MSEFKRQHPVAAITRAIELVRGNLITIVIVLVFGAGGGGPSFIWIFTGLFVFLLVAGTAGWWRFVYRIEDGELQIQQGILVRKKYYMTRDRVQVIDVTAGILQRMFGLVSVEIKTAGSTSREASLSAVSKAEAEKITFLLRGNGELREQDDAGGRPDEREVSRQFRLPVKDLLIAASTSGSFGIALSIIATVFSQIEPLLDETEMYEWFLAVIPSDSDTMFIISFVLFFVFFAWVMSFFGTLIRFGDFTLTIHKEEMVIRRGIFEKKRITVPYNRIQALRIVEGVMRQPFGYATLFVESAGYGDQKDSGSVVLFPLIKTSQVDSFIAEILPEYQCELPQLKPPPRAVTRYIIRSSAVVALVLAGIYWLLGAAGFVWFFMIPGLFWGWLRYRDAAVGTGVEKMVIRGRVLARTTAVIRRNRVQDITSSASWIQRLRGLANIEVTVASGDQGRSLQIRELENDAASSLLLWLSANHVPAADDSGPPAAKEHFPGWE